MDDGDRMAQPLPQDFRAIVSVPAVSAGDFIPAAAVDLLPLPTIAIDRISESSELRAFLTFLWNHEISVTDSSGRTEASLDGERFAAYYSTAYLHELHNHVSGLAHQVDNLGSPELALAVGQAVAHLLVLKGVVQHVLEESMFFSIAHLLDVEDSATASALLASELHTRQANQVLRTIIEDATLPLHFMIDGAAFDNWKRGSYRTPSLRGDKGLLADLVAGGVIPSDLADGIDRIYGGLNGAIHGAERDLIHSGIFSGDGPRSEVTVERQLGRWSELYTESLTIVVKLIRASIVEWESRRPTGEFCDVCHSDQDFDWSRFEHGGVDYIVRRCSRCSSSRTRLAGSASEGR